MPTREMVTRDRWFLAEFDDEGNFIRVIESRYRPPFDPFVKPPGLLSRLMRKGRSR